MACSAIYFLDMKGKVLMNRNYRGDIENNVIDKFIGWCSWCLLFAEVDDLLGLVSDMEDDDNASPLIKTEECTFAYIKHSNVYIVATTRKNSNIVMLFTLLHRICQVM